MQTYTLTPEEHEAIRACNQLGNERYWHVGNLWSRVADRLGFHVLTVHQADPECPDFTAKAR